MDGQDAAGKRMADQPEYLTKKEAAAYMSARWYRIAPSTLMKYVKEGMGPVAIRHGHGRPVLFPRSGLDEWAKQQLVPTPPTMVPASVLDPLPDSNTPAVIKVRALGHGPAIRICVLMLLASRDGWGCQSCDDDGFLEIDHVQPIAIAKYLPAAEQFALFQLTNLQLLCAPCHRKKKTEDDKLINLAAAAAGYHRKSGHWEYDPATAMNLSSPLTTALSARRA